MANKIDLRIKWSKEDDEYLRREYPHNTAKEVAKALNRSVTSVQSRVISLGIGKAMTTSSRDSSWWAVYRGEDFITHGTIKDIAKTLGMSEYATRHHSYPYQRKRAAGSRNRLHFVFVSEE